MYNLMLEINRKCNLRCKYCYLGDKDNKEMNKEVFEKVINIFIREALKHNDKTIFISFIGGEPLLDFNKIKNFVESIEEKCRDNELKCLYGVTTNGTLLNKEIIDYLIWKRFDLKVSLDGSETAHDKNRVFYDGTGSHSLIIDNIKQILRYEDELGKKCVIANVITPNNVEFLTSSLSYIYNLGFKILESGIDIYDNWTPEKVNVLKSELLNSFRLYKTIKNRGDSVTWAYIDNKLRTFFSEKCFYRCKAGLYSSYVDLEGNIYTCDTIPDFKIGDYNKGLDYVRIREIICNEDRAIDICKSCKYVNKCDARSCFTKNFRINNNIYVPVKINCIETKLLSNIFDCELEQNQKDIFKNYFCTK